MIPTFKSNSLMREVMAYFSDREAPFPPSRIDWAMGLERGTAHDLIVRYWAIDKANASGRLAEYHEQL